MQEKIFPFEKLTKFNLMHRTNTPLQKEKKRTVYIIKQKFQN